MSATAHAAQSRRIGRLILWGGVALAAFVYWNAAAHPPMVLDDITSPGYTKAMNREVGRLMGHGGIVMMDLNGILTSPPAKALGVMAIAGLLAGYFYRVAWVLDEEERERLEAQGRADA